VSQIAQIKHAHDFYCTVFKTNRTTKLRCESVQMQQGKHAPGAGHTAAHHDYLEFHDGGASGAGATEPRLGGIHGCLFVFVCLFVLFRLLNFESHYNFVLSSSHTAALGQWSSNVCAQAIQSQVGPGRAGQESREGGE
jgi:hypothetical protein